MAIRPSDLNGPDSLPPGQTQPSVTPEGFPDPQATSIPRGEPDPSQNLTDDPLEAQLAEAFLNNEVDDTDPGEPGVPGEPPPEAEEEEEQEPEGQPPVEEEVEEEEEEEQESPTTPPEEPEGEEDDPVLVELDDNQYTQSQVTTALELLQWRDNLSEQERQSINALYDPNYRLVEVGTLNDFVEQQVHERLEALSQLQPSQQQPGQQPGQQSQDDDYLDPRAASEIQRLNQELAELKGTVTQTQQTAEQEAAIRLQQEVEAGKAAFREAYGDVTDEAYTRIEQAATQLNIVPALAQQGRAVSQAVREGLEVAWRNMPDYQQQMVEQRLEEERKARKATDSKKKKASKVGGSNGTVSRKRRTPSTREERQEAMVEEIAQAVNQGQ